MTETMASVANDHDSDYTDIDGDSMSDLTTPNCSMNKEKQRFQHQ